MRSGHPFVGSPLSNAPRFARVGSPLADAPSSDLRRRTESAERPQADCLRQQDAVFLQAAHECATEKRRAFR